MDKTSIGYRKFLIENISVCGERIKSLSYSIEKNTYLFPLSLESLSALNEDQKESIDALILRYSQCVAMIQDQIFRGVLLALQEDISDKSNRDKSLLMEKLGAIKSADEFGAAAVLRNKFAHFYPEQSQNQLEKLNQVILEAQFAVDTFSMISSYAKGKGLLADDKDDVGRN